MARQKIDLGSGVPVTGVHPAIRWRPNAAILAALTDDGSATLVDVRVWSNNRLSLDLTGGDFSDALEQNVAGISLEWGGRTFDMSGARVDSREPYNLTKAGLWVFVRRGSQRTGVSLTLDDGVNFEVRKGSQVYTAVYKGSQEYTAAYKGAQKYAG